MDCDAARRRHPRHPGPARRRVETRHPRRGRRAHRPARPVRLAERVAGVGAPCQTAARHHPHPVARCGRQLELDGVADAAAKALTGWRYELFATDSTSTDIAWLDARHRKHARVEDRIRCGKDTGAAKYPFQGFAANTAWLVLHAIADVLLAWMKLLACDGRLAKAEPKPLQDAILHAPASLTRGSRRRWLNFPRTWPPTRAIVSIFARILALPAPSRQPLSS